MDGSDPPRLSKDGGSPAERRLAALVERSQADLGTQEQVLALEARLVGIIGTAAPSAPQPGSATAPGGGASAVVAPAAVKTAAAIAVTLAVGSGIWFVTSRHSGGPSPERAPVVAPAPLPPPSPAAPAVTEAQPEPAPTPAVEPDTAASNRALPTKAAPSESELLGQAQSALAGSPGRALALCERHRQLYPRGVLVQEREVLAVESLERLGRHREAVARGERFLKAFPGSAHRNKIFAIVGR